LTSPAAHPLPRRHTTARPAGRKCEEQRASMRELDVQIPYGFENRSGTVYGHRTGLTSHSHYRCGCGYQSPRGDWVRANGQSKRTGQGNLLCAHSETGRSWQPQPTPSASQDYRFTSAFSPGISRCVCCLVHDEIRKWIGLLEVRERYMSVIQLEANRSKRMIVLHEAKPLPTALQTLTSVSRTLGSKRGLQRGRLMRISRSGTR
jgi:hypothetical protein